MSLTAQPNNKHGNNTKGQLREQLMYKSYNIQRLLHQMKIVTLINLLTVGTKII